MLSDSYKLGYTFGKYALSRVDRAILMKVFNKMPGNAKYKLNKFMRLKPEQAGDIWEEGLTAVFKEFPDILKPNATRPFKAHSKKIRIKSFLDDRTYWGPNGKVRSGKG